MRSTPNSPFWSRAGDGSPNRADRSRDTAWAEGLRGLSAVGVVVSHLSLSFARQFVPPCDGGPDGTSRLFQLPIFRLIVQGQAFVALFFILTGFVNSLKPLKQTHSNDIEGALVALARSSLNRIPRLILPAVAVTILAWFACQLRFFELARQSDAYWLAINSRAPSSTWLSAAEDLVIAVRDTWLWGENPYDQPQWALPYLLKASMYIFIVLLITATTRPAFRFAVFGIAYIWSWVSGDGLLGINVFAGMFLAELHTTQLIPSLKSPFLRILPLLSAVLGLFLMSFPSEYHDWKPWTRALETIGQYIFPYYGEGAGRFWPGIGAQILCLSIQVSPDLRYVLSARFFTFLGSISFSMYLLHGPLMCSLLAWMTFGPNWLFGEGMVNGKITPPEPSAFLVILPLFAGILLSVSSVWTCKVEPYFGRATKMIQNIALPSRHADRERFDEKHILPK